MGMQIKVFDTFEDKEIYNQYFFASKQFIENKSLDYCQIDSCRIASINESIPVNIIRWIMLIYVIPLYLLMQQNAKKKAFMQLLF